MFRLARIQHWRVYQFWGGGPFSVSDLGFRFRVLVLAFGVLGTLFMLVNPQKPFS